MNDALAGELGIKNVIKRSDIAEMSFDSSFPDPRTIWTLSDGTRVAPLCGLCNEPASVFRWSGEKDSPMDAYFLRCEYHLTAQR